ncbi:hypothetical protein L210DRAFT_3565884 [Boletus edulis BED1]|uniref:Uncharacterized protein n=1 Tax=Boletus edulis BED1 TaxID=1328754 RepID=A0AAD4BFR0_BOLED|nr:hypothetical protein L210DRAFT_3565884 [Boletus edulis BED1]
MDAGRGVLNSVNCKTQTENSFWDRSLRTTRRGSLMEEGESPMSPALKDSTFSDGTFIPKGALIAAALPSGCTIYFRLQICQ